jgi:hypothetical protein
MEKGEMRDNPYVSPETGSVHQPSGEHDTAEKRGFDVGSVVLSVTALFFSGWVLAWVIRTQSHFNRIFHDFGTELPPLTRFVGSAPFVWLVGLLFCLTGVKELFLRNRAAKATCNTIAICGALILGALYVEGMLLPLIRLIEKLSSR